MLNKPSNAKWIGKGIFDGVAQTAQWAAPDPKMAKQPFPCLEAAWYDDGRVKLTFKDGAPAYLSQVYLTGAGRDLIVEFKKP
jgi:hypothetical protein